MKITESIRNHYGRIVAVPSMSLLAVPAFAQTEGGGGPDISSATSVLEGMTGQIATIGGLLLAGVATIALWKYLKAAAAS